MRKTIDARTAARKADTRPIDGYHSSRGGDTARDYSQRGYDEHYYYASDRKIKLVTDGNGHHVRPDGKPAAGYGLEIETYNNSISVQSVHDAVIRTMALNVFDRDLFKLQEDSSLPGRTNGECITQVMSAEFVRNNYARWKRFWDESLPAIGSRADHRQCGMHINISTALFGKTPEAQETAMRKLTYWVNAHYELACALVMRDPTAAETYAGRMYQWTNAEKAKTRTIDNTRVNSFGRRYGDDCGHGVCVNWAHVPEHVSTARLEFRLVGGQSNYIEFRNTIECVFHLVSAVKSTPWSQLDDMTRFFRGCNKYVLSRLIDARNAGLLSTNDYTEICASADTTTNYEVTLA